MEMKLAIMKILKNPAEFLINKYLRNGKNTLVLKIFRWSTALSLECQDFFGV